MTRFSQRFRLTGGSEANSVNKWFGGGFATQPGDFESISTVTVGSSGYSTISFTLIPTTWTHLQLRGLVRSTNGNIGGDSVTVSLNSNTTYRSHYLYGEGSGSNQAGTDVIRNYIGRAPSASDTASVFGGFVCDILDYKNTSKFKTGRSNFGFDLNGSGNIYLSSFLYQSTTAVSSLTLTIYGGYTFAEYSKVALYGIKVAV